jgi:hypothetical protein
MNRQQLITKRSLTRGSARFLVSATLVHSALLLAACSDDPSPGTPSFTSTTDTSSTSAPSTTSVTPTTTATPVTPVTPTNVTPTSTTSNPTNSTSTTSSSSSSSSSSSEQSADTSVPAETAVSDDSSEVIETADTTATSVDLPSIVLGDAGADASVSEAADTSEPVVETSDTEAPVAIDASVTEPETTEATSAPEVTSDEPPATTEEEVTSAPAASSSAEVTSDSPYGPNLITNPGFEGDSTTGWMAFGSSTISAENTYSHSGIYSGFATGRTATWNGIAVDLLATADAATTYHVEASVRIAGAASDTVKLTFAFNCNNAGATYLDGASGTASNTAWTNLSGEVTLPVCATTVTQLTFYVQGPATGIDIYVDDVSVREVL